MTKPTGVTDDIRTYYDEHVEAKLRGLLQRNARVEVGCRTIGEWAPASPSRILEIGCGMGEVCWRMSRCYPHARIQGIDISAKSIETARKLFSGDRLDFRQALVVPELFDTAFDLIVMMDVYEHIAREDRPILHEALAKFLSPQGRLILTFPTPRKLAWLRQHDPKGIQPVDEDVTAATIFQVSQDTQTSILFYREVDIWDTGDYAHAVLGRGGFLEPVPPNPGLAGRVARRLRLISGARNGMSRPPQAEIEQVIADRLGAEAVGRLRSSTT